MIDVMNAMGYRAAAIGNHDFDFDLENLQARADQANFPFLSANLSYQDDGSIPEFADPYVILDTNGVRVGILGLTTKETRIDTKPEAVDDLEFGAYEETIETYVPRMREEGADLILLISHLCAGDTGKLASLAAEQGIAVIGGGHCHKVVNEVANGTRIIESSYFMRGYTRLDLYFDTVEGEVILADAEYVPNKEGRADPVISEIIETWRDRVDPELWEVIGFTEGEIDRRTRVMDEIVPGSWLRAYPEADVALASRRYMQQDIDAGDITRGSILGVLATDNRILEVSLTGEDLIHTIISRDPMLAGITEEGEEFILSDGSSVKIDDVYRVLIPHSLYSGGNYYEFHLFDENPVDIGMNWLDPVIDWIQSLDTSRENPLDQLLGSS
jgi:2',3'-cyclic-nucleotide 2'-phosphodiesterase/3'-nucleotidase